MKKIYFSLILTAALILAAASAFGQSTAGPIMITEFADSTNITAGDNFPQQLYLDSTYTVKGSYGNIGAAKTVRVSYDVYKSDWSGLEYSATWIHADDTTGTLDGTINADFTFAPDAALFGAFPGAFYIIQTRVIYDPVEDTFWNIFVEVADGTGLAIERPMIDGIKMFPNPAREGYIVIETPRNLKKSVMIMDMFGKNVLTTDLMSNGKIDVSSFASGVYTVIVKEDDHYAVQKMTF